MMVSGRRCATLTPDRTKDLRTNVLDPAWVRWFLVQTTLEKMGGRTSIKAERKAGHAHVPVCHPTLGGKPLRPLL